MLHNSSGAKRAQTKRRPTQYKLIQLKPKLQNLQKKLTYQHQITKDRAKRIWQTKNKVIRIYQPLSLVAIPTSRRNKTVE